MEPLTWTGSIAFLNPLFALGLALMVLSIAVWMLASIVLPEDQMTVNPDGRRVLTTTMTITMPAVDLLAAAARRRTGH